MRDLSRKSSEQRSILMGRVVDSYTNILTVKLFSRMSNEDAYVRDAINDHADAIAAHMRTRDQVLDHFIGAQRLAVGCDDSNWNFALGSWRC